MKFIRDIISEKRSANPPEMALPQAANPETRPETRLETLILTDHGFAHQAPGVGAEIQTASVTDHAPDHEANIFAMEDVPAHDASQHRHATMPQHTMSPVDTAHFQHSAPPYRPVETPPTNLSLSEMPFVSVQATDPPQDSAPDGEMQVPPPAAGRGANRSGRVKTRLLGFNPEAMGLASPFEKVEKPVNEAFPVGWLVVTAGPGRGASFPLHDGVARIGRSEDQTVCLNFGDNSISRENHVSVAYDSEQNAFFIGQSGRSNIVRLNNKPLLSTEQVRSGDQIRVGETTLRLAALCGEGFSWVTNH